MHADGTSGLPPDNLVTVVVKIETAKAADQLTRVANDMFRWGRRPGYRRAVAAIAGWFDQVVAPRKWPGVRWAELLDMELDEEEEESMLAETVKRWTEAPPQSSAPPTSSRSAGTAAPRLRRQVEGVEALMGLAPRTQREGKPFARAQVERRARFHAQVVEVQSRLRGDVARPLRLGKPAAPRPLPVDAPVERHAQVVEPAVAIGLPSDRVKRNVSL